MPAVVADQDEVAYWRRRLAAQRFAAVAHRFDPDGSGIYKGLPRPTLCGGFQRPRVGKESDAPKVGCTACDTVLAARRVEVEAHNTPGGCGCGQTARLAATLVESR